MKLSGKFTGEGGGVICFREGNLPPMVSPVSPETHIEGDDYGEIGFKSAWGRFEKEMSTRDEGFRGVSIEHNYVDSHPEDIQKKMRKNGIVDHKVNTARNLLKALHQGDAAYFEGLAKAIRKYNALPEKRIYVKNLHFSKWPIVKDFSQVAEWPDQFNEVIEAIGKAAEKAKGVPFDHQVNDQLKTRQRLDALRNNYLRPLGFAWLPSRPRGRPRKKIP